MEAILPTENTETQQLLEVEDYSERSFTVRGELTRQYKDSLKALGGKFNRNLRGGPAWIFAKTKQEPVMEFVMQINSGETPTLPTFNGDLELPTIDRSSLKQKSYQWVKFKIFKPREGMGVNLKMGGKVVMEGKVVKTETTKDIVDTVYIDFGEQMSKGVICRGKWQIFGYDHDHSLFFTD